MNDPAPEISGMWLPRSPDHIFALGHRVVRCDHTTGHVSRPIAFCESPIIAQAIAMALKEKIERVRRTARSAM